ncbi:hypothetical protein CHLNCDRAFT_136354 [Chlorella variabilis]|uniref:Peptidase C1A papain C-terminal domain-containing protein n=1 Tax=Chlorella variabilis TaxID=554065 RepID=E1ZK69_CHLVA|nr:hypothetical protein CHLNCDRAFT_136354 [Chlorella variabilis]EFN53751.1 hypothetical protein CHLNCDRAFT_136354 [Chlorella variabilis]|eukprot:XP_005845853.1 hypothetical protein CHLNCDRAFT_136354 [Chlorella variabilis]
MAEAAMASAGGLQLRSPRAPPPAPHLQQQRRRPQPRCRARSSEQAAGRATPLDVMRSDISFLEHRTGLDLLTPLEAVAKAHVEAHDEVVAVLNPIAGEQMQRHLEEQIAGMQRELAAAHTQIHRSEGRLQDTVQHLTRLEGSVRQAFGGAAEAPPAARSAGGAAASAAATAAASTQTATSTPAPAHTQQAPRRAQQQRQRRGRDDGLASSLTLPEQLKDHWFPAEFSASLAEGKMVPFELFGQASMMPTQLLLAAAALALLAAPLPAAASCRKVRKHVPREEMFFNHQPAPQKSLEELPKEWSWNKVEGRSMLAPSWNQHIPQYCGSCWLHATTSMIQVRQVAAVDRLKIVKGGIGPDTMLARQVVLNCGAFHGYGEGCNGGDVIDVVRYMKSYGLPDESCQVVAVAAAAVVVVVVVVAGGDSGQWRLVVVSVGYAIPTWQDEQDVRSGKKLGTMWGIFSKEDADKIIPEGHRHPHFSKDQPEDDSATASEFKDTPEDRPEGPAAAAERYGGSAAVEGGAAARGKQAQQPSLRVEPFGGRQQA